VLGETDSAGVFRLAVDRAARYLVRLEMRGLAPCVLDGAEAGTPLRVTLARGGIVHGIVRARPSGTPVAGAAVESRDVRARELARLDRVSASFAPSRTPRDGSR